MGHWNYRICQRADGTFSLNEVFYGDGGKETSMTAEAIGFVADADEGPEGIVKSLKMALRDARKRPVFKVPQRWEESIDEAHPAPDGDDDEAGTLHESAEHARLMFASIAIGTEFFAESGKWRCTDKGSRTIIAIRLNQEDETWHNGPPYAVAETVFDEYDLEGVVLTEEEWRKTFGED